MSTLRDPRTFIWDAAEAAQHIRQFVQHKDLADYENDILLRSAVERQLEIIGEALNHLSRSDMERAAQVPQLRSIVGLRNILVHGYAELDDARVWDVVQNHLPSLQAVLERMLADEPA